MTSKTTYTNSTAYKVEGLFPVVTEVLAVAFLLVGTITVLAGMPTPEALMAATASAVAALPVYYGLTRRA